MASRYKNVYGVYFVDKINRLRLVNVKGNNRIEARKRFRKRYRAYWYPIICLFKDKQVGGFKGFDNII